MNPKPAETYFPESQAEFWKLIAERRALMHRAEEIDQLIWERFGENGAILFTDLVGFTRQSAELGITHFLQMFLEAQRLLRPVVDSFGGNVFEVVGDSMLVLFPTAEACVRCAVAMQQECHRANETLHQPEHLRLCLGIGYGRILRIGSTRLAGGELNVASKLGEDFATGSEILLSQSAKFACEGLADVRFQLTEHTLPGSELIFRLHYDLRSSD